MVSILKIIVHLFLALGPLAKKYKKTTTAVAATGVTTAALMYSGGVTNPPSPFNYGNVANLPGSDGDVLTSDGDGTYTMKAGGGGGGGTSFVGTPTAGDQPYYNADASTPGYYLSKPTYNVVHYGAGTDYRQAESTGTNGAGTTFNLASGHGDYFKVGNSVVIPGAGAAHQWAAVTPTTPSVTAGGSTTFTGATTDIITVASYLGVSSGVTFTRSSNTIVTYHLGVADGHSCYLETSAADLPAGLSTGTEYFLRQVAGTTTSYTLHTSRAGALANTNQVTLSDDGTGTHTIHVTMPVRVASTTTLPGGLSVDTTYYLRQSTTLYTYTVHDTAANAAGNSGTVDITDTGTGTHSLMPWGGETATYSVVGISGAGGYTAPSTAGSTSAASQTLTLVTKNSVDWGPIVDGSSNEVNGYYVYGDRVGGTRRILTRINATGNAFKITMQAGGYTNCVPTDIGKSMTGGTLVRYDNATREWIVKGGTSSTPASFPNATACTITGGTGAGTTTGSASKWYVWQDCGDVEADYDCSTMVWRTGHEEQVIEISGTPTGGTYSVYYMGYEANVAYNASSATLKSALRALPGLEKIDVVTRGGSGANLKHTIRFGYDANSEWGLGDPPPLTARSYMTGGTPVITIATTRSGKTINEGDIIVHPATSSGSLYECIDAGAWRGDSRYAPSLSTTLNAQKWTSRGARWQRVNALFPVAEPAGAEENAYLGKIVAKSSDALTLGSTTTTSVASGTPVFRDDLPGFQAAFTAAKASGNAEIEVPGGDYSWFSRVGGVHSEWTLSSGGGNNEYTLFPFATTGSTASIGFNLKGNATVRWRAMEVSSFRNDGSDSEQRDFHALFHLRTALGFYWSGGRLIYAPSSEPLAEYGGAQHSVRMFRQGGTIVASQNVDSVKITNTKIIGLPNGMGIVYESGYVPQTIPLLRDVYLRYGGGGHDAGMGPTGNWRSCWIDGTNTRYRSTGLYTNFGAIPVSLWDCHLRQIGKDGIRMRNKNFEMIGGSIVNDSRANVDNIIEFESTAAGGRVSGVVINTPWEEFDINCDNISVENCKLINTFITAENSDDLKIVGNKYTLNGGIPSSNSEKCVDIKDGCDVVLVRGNQVRVATNMPASASYVVSGISLGNSSNVTITDNSFASFGTTGRGILVNTGFAGMAIIANNRFVGSAVGSSQSNLLQAAAGASIKCSGNVWDGSTKDNATTVSGSTNARYEFSHDTFLNEFEVTANPTGVIILDGCYFADGSNAADFLDAGTIVRNCDFAIAPSLTGATLNLNRNLLAGVASVSATALAASQNNYALPVTDTVILTTSGTNNYSITGFAARAAGCTVVIVNGDSTDTITLEHADAGSSAANQIRGTGGADVVLGPGESATIRYANSLWQATEN